jgi:hypothetical protein
MATAKTKTESAFINEDVALKDAVLKRRLIKGQYKAIIESSDHRVIWLQACKNGVMATSTAKFAKVVLG